MYEYENEEWRPVVGWDDYEVSSYARVRRPARSVTRSDGKVLHFRSRMVPIYQNCDGYAYVRLRRSRKDEDRPFVHELIADAFGLDSHDVLCIYGDLIHNCNGPIEVWSLYNGSLVGEEWRDISGYSDYQVSNYSRVRKTKDSIFGRIPVKILEQSTRNDDQRPYVCLRNGDARCSAFVDHLVASTFVDRPHGCSFIKHIDGDESNNLASNLQWVESLVDGHGIHFDEEVWRPVVGWEDAYEISSEGHLRSIDRIVRHSNGTEYLRHGKMLSLRPDALGYVMVCLSRGGETRYVSAHRLVAEAFLGDHGDTCEVDHINGIRNDNRVCNLRWCTRLENNQNRVLDGSRKTVNEHVDDDEPDNLPGEEWRDAVGHHGYLVSSLGRVWSKPIEVNTTGGTRVVPGGIIKPTISSSGGVVVYLSKPKKCAVSVDTMVADAFMPEHDDDELLFHVNLDLSDCTLQNLRWATIDEISSIVSEISAHNHVDGDEWRDVPGYEGILQASASGKVRQLDRAVRCVRYRIVKGRVLTPFTDERGRTLVRFCLDQKKHVCDLNEIIAETFAVSEEDDTCVA